MGREATAALTAAADAADAPRLSGQGAPPPIPHMIGVPGNGPGHQNPVNADTENITMKTKTNIRAGQDYQLSE